MTNFSIPILLGIIIILLHSNIKLTNKYNQIKYEYDYMAHYILDVYNQVCSLHKASKKVAAKTANSKVSATKAKAKKTI